MEFLERVKRAGFAVPELDARPSLTGWESEMWPAFLAVHQQRRTGMAGSEPLDVVQVRSWLQAHGWRGDLEAEALDLILAMDSAFMTWGRKEADGPGS